ncbi:TM2 domain-containing protein [Hymenobacter gummosus]|nr:TM2 domain-containing protein [Hymenobacter gummosus]
MGKFSSLFATALAVVTLASCSKESYTFRSSAPYGTTYTAATKVEPVTEAAPAAEAATAPELTASTVAAPVAAPKAARTYAAHAQASKASVAKAETKAAPTRAEVKEAKAAVKAMHKAAKKAKAAAPAASGKSQLVAALLCFFLGGLSIHRFYLGYTGLAILQIVLNIFIIGFIWVLIDLIRILTGSLQPKNGTYEKTL